MLSSWQFKGLLLNQCCRNKRTRLIWLEIYHSNHFISSKSDWNWSVASNGGIFNFKCELDFVLLSNQFGAATGNRIFGQGKYQILSICRSFFFTLLLLPQRTWSIHTLRTFYNFTAAPFNWITQHQSWKYNTHTHTRTH